MKTTSAVFDAAVRGSHRMLARARLVAPGQVGTEPDGDPIDVNDGNVVLDGTADVRGTLDLTTNGYGWDPRYGRSSVQPYGRAELFVERGILVAAGKTEYVPLGYYRLYEVEQESAPNGQLRVTAQDRMSALVDARFTAPQQFPASAIDSSVVEQLVTEVMPHVEVDWRIGSQRLGRSIVSEQDRYPFIDDIVTGRGAIWWIDESGRVVVDQVPDPTDPVFTVDGGPSGVLVTASRSISREGIYNAVIASGEGADDTAPVSAIAFDNDPASPTYWRGDYGQVPEFYSSPLLTSQDGAASAARSLLSQAIGLPFNLDFTMVPHPALEPYDVVRVRYPGFAETHVVDKVTIPLTAKAALSATARESTTAQIGVS